jgi:hypothetical protein
LREKREILLSRNGENYEGWLASYPPGGYVEMLTPDYPKTNDKFLAMKQNGFISEKTRAIFLDTWIHHCKHDQV